VAEKVRTRDQEIARLHQSYQGGQTFPQVKQAYQRDQEFDAVLGERDSLLT